MANDIPLILICCKGKWFEIDGYRRILLSTITILHIKAEQRGGGQLRRGSDRRRLIEVCNSQPDIFYRIAHQWTDHAAERHCIRNADKIAFVSCKIQIRGIDTSLLVQRAGNARFKKLARSSRI